MSPEPSEMNDVSQSLTTFHSQKLNELTSNSPKGSPTFRIEVIEEKNAQSDDQNNISNSNYNNEISSSKDPYVEGSIALINLFDNYDNSSNNNI